MSTTRTRKDIISCEVMFRNKSKKIKVALISSGPVLHDLFT
jgi:hypothetical protein